jgi:DNA-binding transcriptional LysR family regulator
VPLATPNLEDPVDAGKPGREMAASFSTIDLNLLRVFDAVMEERSVLRASQKVCLSQSAVSHSLARLREMLDDELFIRTATGMQPTGRALAMAGMVRDALKTLEAAIELPKFDPATSTRTFTLAANDFTTMVVAPSLLHVLRTEAPQVDIVIKPVTRIDLAEQIDLGRIDAAIGTFSAVPSRFKSGLLFEYDDVLITHASNKRARSTASSPNAAWRADPRCMTGPRSSGQCPHRSRYRESRSRCPIFSRFRLSSMVQACRRSSRALSPTPLPAPTRFRSTNFPTQRRAWRFDRCGTSGMKATPRRIGFTRSCDGRRNTSAARNSRGRRLFHNCP